MVVNIVDVGWATSKSGCLPITGWGDSIYVRLDCSYDPPDGHPGQHANTFVLRILSMSPPQFQSFNRCTKYVGIGQRKFQGDLKGQCYEILDF